MALSGLSEREILARTIRAEAGNQSAQGRMAVGSVIMNRAARGGYGDGVRGVITKPGQFSPWNSVTGYAGGAQGVDMSRVQPSAEDYRITDLLLSGAYDDPTGGAVNFYNPDISNPAWGQAQAGGEWTRIGDHIFGSTGAGHGSSGARRRASTGKTDMRQQEQQPRGLLGALGIERQDPSAGGQTAQPFMQRDRFKDAMANLAIGMQGMTMNPNQAMMGALAGGVQERAGARATSQQRNATAEWLANNGFPDLAEGVQTGAIPAAAAIQQATAKPKDTRTAMVKNYEYARAAGYQGGFDQFMKDGGGGGTSITIGGQDAQIVGDQVLVKDPESPAGFRLVDIPGGKAALDAAAAQDAAEIKAGSAETSGSVISTSAGRLVAMLDDTGPFNAPEAGILGNALGALGVNQEAVDFRNELEALKGNTAFAKLAEIRASSPTGGALGSVSNIEIGLLMNAYGNINQSTSAEILRENLLTIKRIMGKIDADPVARAAVYGGDGATGSDFAVTGQVGTNE